MTADTIKRKLLDNEFDDTTSGAGLLSRRMAEKGFNCYTCGGKNHKSIDCKYNNDDNSDSERLPTRTKNSNGSVKIAFSNGKIGLKSATNNPLGEGANKVAFLTRCIPTDGNKSQNRSNTHQSRKVYVKGKQSQSHLPFKCKDEKILANSERFKMKEKFASVRDTEDKRQHEDRISKSQMENSAVDEENQVVNDLIVNEGSNSQILSINMASNKEEDVQHVVGCLLDLVSKLTNGATKWSIKRQPVVELSSFGNGNRRCKW